MKTKSKLEKVIIYVLQLEDLSHLGGPMGTEYTTSKYEYFHDIEKAKQFAEKHYGKKIIWKKDGRSITSGDLLWTMYKISKLKIK